MNIKYSILITACISFFVCATNAAEGTFPVLVSNETANYADVNYIGHTNTATTATDNISAVKLDGSANVTLSNVKINDNTQVSTVSQTVWSAPDGLIHSTSSTASLNVENS